MILERLNFALSYPKRSRTLHIAKGKSPNKCQETSTQWSLLYIYFFPAFCSFRRCCVFVFISFCVYFGFLSFFSLLINRMLSVRSQITHKYAILDSSSSFYRMFLVSIDSLFYGCTVPCCWFIFFFYYIVCTLLYSFIRSFARSSSSRWFLFGCTHFFFLVSSFAYSCCCRSVNFYAFFSLSDVACVALFFFCYFIL